MTLTDYMYQERREEEDLPALKIALTLRYNDSSTIKNDDIDETINHIISECSKLAQEYKTGHNWVDMVIHWEMRKKFKWDHTNI